MVSTDLYDVFSESVVPAVSVLLSEMWPGCVFEVALVSQEGFPVVDVSWLDGPSDVMVKELLSPGLTVSSVVSCPNLVFNNPPENLAPETVGSVLDVSVSGVSDGFSEFGFSRVLLNTKRRLSVDFLVLCVWKYFVEFGVHYDLFLTDESVPHNRVVVGEQFFDWFSSLDMLAVSQNDLAAVRLILVLAEDDGWVCRPFSFSWPSPLAADVLEDVAHWLLPDRLFMVRNLLAT